MDHVDIYAFENYADFLAVVGQRALARRNRPYTLDEWAHRLGYKSARSIAMVLKGQRLPSAHMIRQIAEDLALDANARRYFELLVEVKRHRWSEQELRPLLAELRELNPHFGLSTPIDATTFSYIAEWYHLVIKQLLDTPGYRDDDAWVVARLGGKVTEAEVRSAIAVLERLQMVSRQDGRLVVEPRSKHLRTTSDVPDRAIKLHHQQMTKRAMEAMEELESHEREITSITFKCS